MFAHAIRDPDYLNYLLLDGTRVMTGPVVFGAAPAATEGNWKIEHDGTDLIIAVYQSGSWIIKFKFEAT